MSIQVTLFLGVLVSVGAATEHPVEDARPWEMHLKQLSPSASNAVQADAVMGLLKRLIPDRAKDFMVTIDPSIGPQYKDTFMVTSPGTNVSVDVVGTTGVAAAWGLLHYLKYSCNTHVSWEADQLDLPDALPAAQIKVTSVDRFRYYQNVCTVSYSMAWWGWDRWEREIDWMALNGINLPLAFTGQEAIWHRVYTTMGLTQEELDEHFSGPAFFAWARMGNIRGWGGPLSMAWHNQTLALQHKILDRMRQFGILPVLPAFAGHVPAGLTRLYPEANITRMSRWVNFPDQYSRTYLLDPNDPLFLKIGSAFIQEIISEFGTDHIYNCDTFNEMKPASNDPAYLKGVGAAIYGGMAQADPGAIWVMQGWIFYNAQQFWHTEQAKALLTSVPIGRLLVLDLASERAPQYNRLESYFGQPFIFNMLHNYGGVDGLFGNVGTLLQNLKEARAYPNVTMVGTGLTPEGINQNYVMYDFMNEMGWRQEAPNVTQWAGNYSGRRYGSNDPRLVTAWQYLMRSVYDCQIFLRFHGRHIILARRPSLHPNYLMWYNMTDVVAAWDLLVEVARGDADDASRAHEDLEGVGMDPAIPAGQGAIKQGDARRGGSEQEGNPPPRRGFSAREEDADQQGFIATVGGDAPMPRHSLERNREPQQQRLRRSVQPRPVPPARPSYAGEASGPQQQDMSKEDYHEEGGDRRWDAREGGEGGEGGEGREGEREARRPRERRAKVTDQDTFRHDLVDVTRQILQVTGGQMVMKMIDHYRNKVLLAVQESHLLLIDLLKDMEELLASSPDFLLGRWLRDAASWATTQEERDLYLYNALNQISLWGPQGQITDYAVKQWAGVVSDYLMPRWDKFGRALVECLAEGKPFDQLAFGEDLFKTVEEPFTKNVNRTFNSEPIGDSVEIALRLHAKYRPVYDARFLGYLEQRHRQLLVKGERKMKRKMKKEGKLKKGMVKKMKKETMKKKGTMKVEEEDDGREMKMELDSWRENSIKAFEE
ncbi:alpha-N-acetylglucosaminidase-like isoform X3 [Penaeus japonicus]|uniref:alpha-N-acetylglucosaminidase-like isoform X3 n=1 Tax=Penaeus japonicus TaxID=27405 RepID=UPI001C70FF8A|nr:alpha-N-acetylglucosaminidase-like isoform X3 [Penaeus japonicus]